MAPYASIIIPAHSRAETLSFSIDSALTQTVPDIEVLVVGDGCTAEVRRVATQYVEADARVRFLDNPKAPMRGAKNRHDAVMNASGAFIFYNDDDDLLLPWHVETLGKALEHSHIVDTPPVSVNPDGRLAYGVHDSGHHVLRRLLREGRYKGVFDTHFAHRKSAYVGGEGAWLATKDRRVVLQMLQYLASNEALSWCTLQEVTALSFHGAPRLGMPGPTRANELKTWMSHLQSTDSAGLRETSSVAFHALRLLRVLRAIDDSSTFDDLVGNSSLSDAHRSEAAALCALLDGQQVSANHANSLLDNLLDARLGAEDATPQIVNLFLQTYPSGSLRAMLQSCEPRSCVQMALFHLDFLSGEFTDASENLAVAAWQSAEDWRKAFVGQSVAHRYVQSDDFETAWEWLEQAKPYLPQSFQAAAYWRARAHVGNRLGFADEVKTAKANQDELSRSMA